MNDATREQVAALATMVASHEVYRDLPWHGISIVGDFAGGQRSMFGYVYLSDGSWESKLPRDPSRAVMKAFRRLHEAMAAHDGRPWEQCLLQVRRDGSQPTAAFDYSPSPRWVVSAGDPDGLAEALRPSRPQ